MLMIFKALGDFIKINLLKSYVISDIFVDEFLFIGIGRMVGIDRLFVFFVFDRIRFNKIRQLYRHLRLC